MGHLTNVGGSIEGDGCEGSGSPLPDFSSVHPLFKFIETFQQKSLAAFLLLINGYFTQ